jgi:hypothetical protein
LLNIITVDLFIANSRKPTQNFVNPQMAPRQATGISISTENSIGENAFAVRFQWGAIDFVYPLGQVPALGHSNEGR